MKINPNDSWYPVNFEPNKGVTIRLEIATRAMQAIVTGLEISGNIPGKDVAEDWIVDESFRLADAMIDRANRDEEKAHLGTVDLEEELARQGGLGRTPKPVDPEEEDALANREETDDGK